MATQKKFRQLAHALEKPVMRELISFAQAVGFGVSRRGYLSSKDYRL